jgi:hypothetical protein
MKWAHQQFKWEVFEHLPYGPNLAPSDHDLFLQHKKFLASQSLRSDHETKDIVQDWLKGVATTVLNEGVQKLVPQYDTCLNLHGNCMYK